MDIALKQSISDYFTSNGFNARLLTKNDIPDIQDFIWECLDYYQDVLGIEPRNDEAERLFKLSDEDQDEEKVLKQNLILGIFSEQNELVSLIQIYEWEEFPKDFDIKLFLIAPDYRNDGLGTIFYDKLIDYMQEIEGRTLFTKIKTHNEIAYKFLLDKGFVLHYVGVEKNCASEASLYNIMKKILKRSLYVK